MVLQVTQVLVRANPAAGSKAPVSAEQQHLQLTAISLRQWAQLSPALAGARHKRRSRVDRNWRSTFGRMPNNPKTVNPASTTRSASNLGQGSRVTPAKLINTVVAKQKTRTIRRA